MFLAVSYQGAMCLFLGHLITEQIRITVSHSGEKTVEYGGNYF